MVYVYVYGIGLCCADLSLRRAFIGCRALFALSIKVAWSIVTHVAEDCKRGLFGMLFGGECC